MILLDTCVLLWLAHDTSCLSETARRKMDVPNEQWAISAISAFEVGQKSLSKKLTLPMTVERWFPAMIRQHNLVELPVTVEIAARATLLPDLHRDPIDRVLIATAMTHDIPLISPDEAIRQYPDLQTLW
ncbi:MAG: type II toxin-antitoxin system VapC family toxin [Verrucomicrobiae bacterium]|nr:type II toxin-antitoxin system VapC family toxin [Verrucomicrobiae bacterium]